MILTLQLLGSIDDYYRTKLKVVRCRLETDLGELMDLRQYLFLLRRWAAPVLLSAILAATASFFWFRAQPPVYRATATLLVNQGDGAAVNNEYSSLLSSERLALSYVERLTNRDVLETAISNLGLDITPEALERAIEVRLIRQTQLLTLSVEHTNPETASALANEIPAVFAERNLNQQIERYADVKESLAAELGELEAELSLAESALERETSRRTPDQVAINQANANLLRLRDTYSRLQQSYEDIRIAETRNHSNVIIDERAQAPLSPVRPQVLQNTVIAFLATALAAVGILFVVERLDDTIKSVDEVKQVTGLSMLGTIEQLKIHNPSEGLVVANEPRSPAAEAYRQIRTNIQFVAVGRQCQTMLVTSANAGDGKTTVTANLATTLAQSGKRVIVVDADLRRPTLADYFGGSDSRGLSNLIIRGREDLSFIQATPVPNLRIITAGRLPPNPAELLGSERMQEIIAWLREQADYVVFDSPPVLAVTDAAVLSQMVDTTLFVVSVGETRASAIKDAVQRLRALDSHIAGTILNKFNPQRSSGYYYYYHYYRESAEEGGRLWRDRLSHVTAQLAALPNRLGIISREEQ